ncbi:MAG TPA: CHASE3 domain-containing protein [Polyangiaceae bacterium]|nr:CHASE3 domain-containing protein [Polyangiaceae bacterium]
MGSSWTFGRRLAVGFVLAGLTLLVVAVFGYQTVEHLVENDRWVTHTTLVRESLAHLLAEVVDAETGQRGFVITGQDEFLEPYTRAVTQIEQNYRELRTLTADNPRQQQRLTQLQKLLDTRQIELRGVIDLRRSGGFEPSGREVAAGRGLHTMEAIRATVDEMDRDESELLAVRRAEAEASSLTARTVIVWGSVLGAVFVGFIGWLISRALSRQIGSTVRHIQSASAELQSAANQQVTSAKEQATAMNEITTTISELLATAKQIAESARRVSTIAGDTSSQARSGDQTVQRTNESIGAIQRQVDLIVSHMLDLGRKSQQIGGILELINELAEQTNILAINATIEAAGAGENGKRFAVVAEEIRRLADRVGASTKEIRQLIEDIRSAVNKTVMTTEGGNKAVEAGARLFEEVAVAFGQITVGMNTTTEAAREIELSTKQQSTAVEQVNVAAANVAQASRETEASSAQTLQTAGELAKLSRALLQIVQAQADA